MELIYRRALFPALTLIAPLLLATPVFAQVLDDVELRREGKDAVAHLRFISAVQFQRSVAVKSGDLVQVFYDLSPSAERPRDAASELRVAGGGQGLPDMIIRDAAVNVRDPFKRRLLIEFSTPTRFTLRPGRRKETIDIVFEGLADAVGAPPATGAAAPSKNFVVVLQSSANATDPLGGSIPAALQDKEVFTSRRVVDGQTVHDFSLGYFATQVEADLALAILRKRFPSAAVAALAAPQPAPRSTAQSASKTTPAASVTPPPVAQASATATQDTPAQPTAKGFSVLLQSSADPAEQLRGSIPAFLQDKEVFTGRRVADGVTVYDISLGYFADEAEARRTQLLISKRFPQASVVAPATAPALTAVATAAPAVTSAPPATTVEPPVAVAAVPSPVAQPVATQPVTPPTAPAPATPAVPAAPLPAPALVLSSPEVEARASELMAQSNAANDSGDYPAAIGILDALLNLPPNSFTRKAQEEIGMTRLKAGDRSRARGEFETFLKLYPQGADSDLVRQFLQNLPPEVAVAQARKGPEPVSVISGSFSTFYYGGESKVQSTDFAESPVGGLATVASNPELTNKDQSQFQYNLDVNWRYRDADREQRFVLRENYSQNLLPNQPDRERLSALYYEQRDFGPGTSFKLGRQSPTGAGILYRFDGVQAGYRFAPKWKVNATYGVPTDPLLDANRVFYGVSVDADALTQHSSGTVFINQQTIDGEVDRSAVGTELRYFNDGVVLSGQIDYDQMLKGLNVLSLQGSWQSQDNMVINFLADRRATPIRTLGNLLFYQTSSPFARSISELLTTVQTDGSISPIDILRNRVNAITSYQTQATTGITVPISEKWQTGANINYTAVDAIPEFHLNEFDFAGQPATGDLWSLGLQLIGSNLYSARDTHVFSFNYLTGPTYQGILYGYNNLTGFEKWQVEPSIRYYTQSDSAGTRVDRWTPGLRMSYRAYKQVTLESDFSYEIAETSSTTRTESAKRMFYYLGGRFDF